MLKSFALACVTVAASLPALCQSPAKPASKVTAVHAAHMLDGVTKSLQGPVTVVLTDGRITSVKPGTRSMAGAEVIELGDATLLPDLIDVHKHMGPPQAGMNTFQARLTVSELESAIGSAGTARKLLEEGFTTVRRMGSSDSRDLSLKRAIDRGWAVGPRILVSLEPLGPPAATATRGTASTPTGPIIAGPAASSTVPSKP